MKFNYINILSSFILTTSYILKVKGNEIQDDFLKDTVRAELFTKTDYNIPDIYINMEQEGLDELFKQGKAGMGGGGKPKDGNPPGGNGMPKEVTVKVKKERFKVTNATLEFVLNGERKLIDSISISVGGQSSKSFNKLGYNIKCNKGNLFGRKVLRLRSTATDASFLRSKLSCDILNRLGDPSISANYARVFFNGTYSGLFVLLDAYKTSWIKKVFPDDKEVSTFYQCNNLNSNFSENNIKTCINANDDYKNEVKPLEDFIYAINAATSREEVEDIMDVDEFVRVWIFEWLTGSWDSSLGEGKNYYMYKQVNGKWIMLPFDFDSTFGHKVQNKKKNASKEAYEIPFDEWYEDRYIVDVLAKNDMDTFVKNLQYILDNAFNPDLLFPHINSLKTWLTPYVVEDHTPVNGTYPGYVNKNSVSITAPFSMEEFDSNSEYTDVQDGIGIKKWIQKRYDFACSYYPVTCKSTTTTSPEDITTTTTIDISSTTTTDSTITSIIETPVTDENCWSKEYGYPCCSNCSVITEDELGLWGAENGKWCGIPTECQTQYDQCWSNYYGYPCCTKCKVILTDELGQWGAEQGEWCGIDKNQLKGNEFQDDFLKDTVRAELFTKTDYNVYDIYINMEVNSIEKLLNKISETTTTTSTSTPNSTITSTVETPVTDENCWSEEYGYPCCSNCSVVTEDELRLCKTENGKWCGIPIECQTQYDQCWSNYYGYPCCTKCKVILTDELGQWGVEHGEWCGIDKNKC